MTHSHWKVAALRAVFRTTQAVSTEAAAWLADRLFCTPPRSRVPGAVREILASAERSWTWADGHRVAVWRWGRGPAVALVHGWGSRAARLTVYVRPLLDRGFSVVAFDAPGHGESEGRLGSGIQTARALHAVALSTPLDGVVAHSLGAAATMFALADGLQLRRAVFIAPPGDIGVYADRFADVLGLRDDVLAAMKRRTAERLRFSWQKLDLIEIAADMRADLLLIHDKGDHEVAWDNGARLAAAWPGARLRTTDGLGHHRVVRDPSVVSEAVGYLAAGADATG